MSAFKLPDGPQTLPLIQTIEWMAHPLEYMEACAQRYGDIFTLRIGPVFTPQVFVSNPQAIGQIFTTDPKQLDSGEPAGIKSPLLGQQSLLALEGKPHQRQRKLLTPPFHGERMLAYGEQIREITKLVTSQWLFDKPFSVLPSMQEISFQVILKAVFGLEDGPRYERLKFVLIALMNPKTPLVTRKKKVQAPKFIYGKRKKCISRRVALLNTASKLQAPKFIYGVLTFDF